MSNSTTALDHIEAVSATVADIDSATQLAATTGAKIRAILGQATPDDWQDFLGRFELLRDERLRLPAENRFFEALAALLRTPP